MTRSALDEFRALRRQHHRHGLGCIRDVQRYRALERDIHDYINGLTGDDRIIMELLYLRGLTLAEVGHRSNFSVSQVKRIHRRVLGKLDIEKEQ